MAGGGGGGWGGSVCPRRAVAHHAKHAGPVLRDGELRVDGLQEPLEAPAAQLLPQLQACRHVPEGLLGTTGLP